MNKKRKHTPSEWSWTSKVFNASVLAKEATEQAQQVDILTEELKSTTQSYFLNIQNLKEQVLSKENENRKLKVCSDEQRASIASLRATVSEINVLRKELAEESRNNKKKMTELQNDNCKKKDEIDDMVQVMGNEGSTYTNRIAALEKELHNTKRECTDSRARKKMWKKKYEELATMGAVALAKITTDSYGVSPQQFQAYKKIADIQLKVDKSEQERTDALKMLHANTTALEDKSL